MIELLIIIPRTSCQAIISRIKFVCLSRLEWCGNRSLDVEFFRLLLDFIPIGTTVWECWWRRLLKIIKLDFHLG
jgi:hypothetical protein